MLNYMQLLLESTANMRNRLHAAKSTQVNNFRTVVVSELKKLVLNIALSLIQLEFYTPDVMRIDQHGQAM